MIISIYNGDDYSGFHILFFYKTKFEQIIYKLSRRSNDINCPTLKFANSFDCKDKM